MKDFIERLKNIFKIEDLRQRIFYTLGILLVYRLGSYIVLPGIDPKGLQEATQSAGSGGLLDILNMFTGGAFNRASIFALGIMPYISASIVIQLLGMAVPYFQRLQREGESGTRKINQLTRYLTVLILVMQAPSFLASITMRFGQGVLVPYAQENQLFFIISSVIILIAGTMFVMWLGERITDNGLGNGISLIIMVGIIARLPYAFFGELVMKLSAGLVAFYVELVTLFLVFVITILLVQGTRRIPVQYAKRIVGNKQYGGVRQYIPLKVNAAGVMPIIFAQAIMFLPLSFAKYGGEGVQGFVAAFSDFTGFWYNFVFFIMIVLFTYFYTAIQVNPVQMAEDMKRNGGFIPGIKPGKKTVEFLDTVMSRITLPGAIFLALVAILPSFAMIAGVEQRFAQFYGGTSLLILVGVILDTLQQIESHLLMRHYDGLMKSGRIKGRTGGASAY